MRIYDIILKKRNSLSLSKDEINFVINNYSLNIIPDYQMSALLMAIFINGMSDQELAFFTSAMANSGDIIDLSSISGTKVDKHSTGGVGDKTTLIITPIVSLFGVKVPKMSGRGLGHTGGTIDKLNSIPNFNTELSQTQFFKVLNDIGCSIISQSSNIAPADKKLYALRDVTATVDSIPLIASSIMSKKIASGADCILLDVKVGSGAFMKSLPDAVLLAQKMVSIGNSCNKNTIALITNMDIPLGSNIGNSLEIAEAVQTLSGRGSEDLTNLCIHLAANMLFLANIDTLPNCLNLVKDIIYSGKALPKLIQLVEAQGGDSSFISNTNNFPKSTFNSVLKASQDGFISSINTQELGVVSCILGAGREKYDDIIDYSAGLVLHKKVGDYIKKGDPIATLFYSDESKISVATQKFFNALSLSSQKIPDTPLILARVEKDNVYYY